MGNHKSGIRRVNVEKILLAAEKVFAEKGYGSTAMADIAEEVQLPRSNLHYYFTTKSELYSAVLFDLLDLWKQDFFDVDPTNATLVIAHKGSPTTTWIRDYHRL